MFPSEIVLKFCQRYVPYKEEKARSIPSFDQPAIEEAFSDSAIPMAPQQAESRAAPGTAKQTMADQYLSALQFPYVEIQPMRIFNRPETRVFYAAKNVLQRLGLRKWHVHGQVSYGRIFQSFAPEEVAEIFGFDPRQGFNSKSADLVITDNEGYPALIVEYQGSGHDSRNDEIKICVCKKAGIRLIFLYPDPPTEEQPLRDYVDIPYVEREITRCLGFEADAQRIH